MNIINKEKPNTKKVISLELSEDLLNAIKEEAKKQELSYSALIRLILKTYIAGD
jgi:predicted DNA binding CopG/RHH family protein